MYNDLIKAILFAVFLSFVAGAALHAAIEMFKKAAQAIGL